MRPLLAVLVFVLLLAGCDVFGSDPIRITYTVNATGAHGPVGLTYDSPNGPVRVENATLPFRQQVQFNSPRIGSVYLVNAQTTCTRPCTLLVEAEAALGGTLTTAEDEVNYTADTTRTIATSASILYR